MTETKNGAGRPACEGCRIAIDGTGPRRAPLPWPRNPARERGSAGCAGCGSVRPAGIAGSHFGEFSPLARRERITQVVRALARNQ